MCYLIEENKIEERKRLTQVMDVVSSAARYTFTFLGL